MLRMRVEYSPEAYNASGTVYYKTRNIQLICTVNTFTIHLFRYVKLIMTNFFKSQLSGIVNPYYLTAFLRKYTGLFSFKQLWFFFVNTSCPCLK